MEDPQYVANGTYGCVLRPPIACKKQYGIKNSISKIFDQRSQKNSEVIIHNRIINKIDPSNYFTVKLIDKCNININDYPATEIIKCKNFENNESDFSQIIYEDGGISLDTYMRDTDNGIIEYKYFERLFKSLVELEKHNSAHVDIKPDNIVYNIDTKKMCLIDFGLLSKISDVYSKKNSFLHAHDYYFYPTDFNVYYHRFNITSNYDDIISKSRIRKFFELWNLNDFIYTDNYNNFDEFYAKVSVISDFSDTNNTTGKTRKFFNKFSNKVDVYMLGISLLIYLSYKLPKYDSNPVFFSKIRDLICNMINLNPEKRYSPMQAYKKFKELINDKNSKIKTPIIKLKSADIKKQMKPSIIIRPCPPGKFRNYITRRCNIKIKKRKMIV